MRLFIFTPLHLREVHEIYMARYQDRFMKVCQERFQNCFTAMTIDTDLTGKFDELFSSSVEYLLDMRDQPRTGIVDPTIEILKKAEEWGADIILRITQDTQITDMNKFVNLIYKVASTNAPFIFGAPDVCDNIRHYLAEMGIYQVCEKVKFVQGNFVFSTAQLWFDYYRKLPESVKHYCDDSLFSYLVEHKAGVAPQFIDWDNAPWKHNPTRDVYYLESLFQGGRDACNLF